MKNLKLLLVALIILVSCTLTAQVAITTDGTDPDGSAMLDVKSENKGMLIPRMTASQRVGIANPATGLLVYQTNDPPGFYYNAGTPDSKNWIQLSSTLISQIEDADGDTKVQVEESADEDHIRFDVNGSEAMTINNIGNVGIGTSNANYKLRVAGDIKISDGGMLLLDRTSEADEYAYIEANTPYWSGIQFKTTQTTAGNIQTAMTIHSRNGNVGIGTVTPPNKLSVAGNADFTGYVGIGTTSPDEQLHVAGKIKVEEMVSGSVTDSLVTWDRADSTLKIIASSSRIGSDDDWTIDTDTLYSASDSTVTIKNGQVGIGTTSPDTSAILELNSSNKGFLPPRMTEIQRYAISSPAAGLVVWCTNCGNDGELHVYNGTKWTNMIGGPAQGLIPTVYNPITDEIWMDRNLGASQVADSSTDANAYGDLYQWGRAAEGHESRTSGQTSTNATTATPNGGNAWDGLFITEFIFPDDWLTPQDNTLWQGASGTNNPCPALFRLPTEAEWDAERLSWVTNNASGAFGSPLKLVIGGIRSSKNGGIGGAGNEGDYWSSSVSGTNASSLYIHLIEPANLNSTSRASGNSVRCIKD